MPDCPQAVGIFAGTIPGGADAGESSPGNQIPESKKDVDNRSGARSYSEVRTDLAVENEPEDRELLVRLDGDRPEKWLLRRIHAGKRGSEGEVKVKSFTDDSSVRRRRAGCAGRARVGRHSRPYFPIGVG